MSQGNPLPTGQYVSLETFRRDGRGVATPLWFVVLDNRVYAYTPDDSGKVKRLRRSDRARLAPCTMRGQATGPWREVTARPETDEARCGEVFAAMARKYPVMYRLLTLIALLSGKRSRRVVLAISLET
jgi:hypothetical protein